MHYLVPKWLESGGLILSFDMDLGSMQYHFQKFFLYPHLSSWCTTTLHNIRDKEKTGHMQTRAFKF